MSAPPNERLIADLLSAHRQQIGFLDALAAVDDRLRGLDARDRVANQDLSEMRGLLAEARAWFDHVKQLGYDGVDPTLRAAIDRHLQDVTS